MINISKSTINVIVGVLIGVSVATPVTYFTTNGGHKSALKSVQPSLTRPTSETTNHNNNKIKIKGSEGIVLTEVTEQTAATIQKNDTCYSIAQIKAMKMRDIRALRRE